jgi:hypothetical protein
LLYAKMSTTILPRSEIDRIRNSLEDVPPNRSRDLKREALKKLSDERQSHWPNTLEAQRKKREQAFADKEAVAEEQRRVIDREVSWLRCSVCSCVASTKVNSRYRKQNEDAWSVWNQSNEPTICCMNRQIA